MPWRAEARNPIHAPLGGAAGRRAVPDRVPDLVRRSSGSATCKLLNQPVFLRGFLYGIFWGIPFTLLTLLATRSEQAKRYLREHPEEHDAH